jgi:hypothetical protein
MLDRAVESIQELREVLLKADDIDINQLTIGDFHILSAVLSLQTSLETENLELILESAKTLKNSQSDSGSVNSPALVNLLAELTPALSQFIQRTTQLDAEKQPDADIALPEKRSSISISSSSQHSRSSSMVGTLFSQKSSVRSLQDVRTLDEETKDKFFRAVTKRLGEIENKIARMYEAGSSQTTVFLHLVTARSMLEDYKISSKTNEDFSKLLVSAKDLKRQIENHNSRASSKGEKILSDKLTKFFETITKYETKTTLAPKISGPIMSR